MPRIVIIHGWSDHGSTFRQLASVLSQKLGAEITEISLAEWESTNDQVTYDDLVTKMDLAWTAAKLPRTPHAVDVIVHSTGGLVIRDWLLRNFGKSTAPNIAAGLLSRPVADNPSAKPTPGNQDPDMATLQARAANAAPPARQPPIKHLVMLAPANYGSPLAHKGTSFIGRIVKGWNPGDMFQVGALVLKGLELGSIYTWSLGQDDRFGAVNFYDTGNVLTTVLVGNEGYSGISAAANEPGSDGTVRASTANLNASFVTADLTSPNDVKYTLRPSCGRVAFKIMDGLNHGTIHDATNETVIAAVVSALTVDDASFPAYCQELDEQTASVVAAREKSSDPYAWGYANAVFFVRDQFFKHITNYFVEFYNDHPSNFLEDIFHRKILQDTHAFSDDNAYRAMLIDTKTLREALQKPQASVVKISLTAEPELSINKVGYSSFNEGDIGAITLSAADVLQVFKPNQTVFIEVIIRRDQKEIFTFTTADPE